MARRGWSSDKAYSQAHLPPAEQQTAIGHAVRFVYLMAAWRIWRA